MAANLDWKREQVIEALTRYYSEDRLSTEEFESRVELASNARTLDQLEDALDGLVPRSSAGYAPLRSEGEGQKIVSVLGSRELRGNWLEADYCSTLNVLGSMVIDLTDTHVPPGLTTLNVFSLMGELTIIVPPDLRIENRITPLLAEVRQQRKLQTDPDSDRVVRITGFSLLSEVILRNSR